VEQKLHSTNAASCHGLRGSVSPVLTATGFVNREWQFSTPYRIDSLNRSPKIVKGHYFGDPYSFAKFCAHTFTSNFSENGSNSLITIFWATVCKTVRSMLSDRCPVCLSVCPVCNADVLWLNGWMDQDETWHGGRPRPWPHCVRWGPSSPSPQGHSVPPIFGLCML